MPSPRPLLFPSLFLLALAASPHPAAAAEHAPPLLDDAGGLPATPALVASADSGVSLGVLLAFAEANAPAMKVAEKRRAYGAAARAGASPLLGANPRLELGFGPRFGGGEHDYDFVASLAQPLEIAGQRGARQEVAERRAQQVDAEAAAVRAALRAELKLSYRLAQVASERLGLAERAAEFAGELAALARSRLDRGDASVIELRLAQADAAQAEQARLAAEQALGAAELRLCALSGWPLQAPPEVGGALPQPWPVPPLERLASVWLSRQPELQARRAALREAEARGELAGRQAWPNVAVGVQLTREGGLDGPANHVVLGTLGLELPLWQRNQGERELARAEIAVAESQEQAASVELEARLVAAHTALRGAIQRLAQFSGRIAVPLEESLRLLRRGFEAGELPFTELSLVRERFLALSRENLDVYADYYRALSELELATGMELDGPRGMDLTGAGGPR